MRSRILRRIRMPPDGVQAQPCIITYAHRGSCSRSVINQSLRRLLKRRKSLRRDTPHRRTECPGCVQRHNECRPAEVKSPPKGAQRLVRGTPTAVCSPSRYRLHQSPSLWALCCLHTLEWTIREGDCSTGEDVGTRARSRDAEDGGSKSQMYG